MERKVFSIKKEEMEGFLSQAASKYRFIAPSRKEDYGFYQVSSFPEIDLSGKTRFPAKGHLFKNKETICEFDGKELKETLPKPEKKVIFGLRRCDLNSILHQDFIFLQEFDDPYYKERRKDTVLIGLHCDSPLTENCFCGSLDLVDFHDLMFFDRGGIYLVEVGSEKGEGFVKEFSSFFEPSDKEIKAEEKKIPGTDKLKEKDIGRFIEHPLWKEGSDMCLSCSACTNLCPSCYCFETEEVVDVKTLPCSKTCRSWSSCQLKDFTRVAMDHIFRESREARFKHRIYHQLHYFKEKYGFNLCTGCGRCIDFCPEKIDFISIINRMGEDGK
jgi:sulfhydrogenase subunit beta (sulfur reductase)